MPETSENQKSDEVQKIVQMLKSYPLSTIDEAVNELGIDTRQPLTQVQTQGNVSILYSPLPVGSKYDFVHKDNAEWPEFAVGARFETLEEVWVLGELVKIVYHMKNTSIVTIKHDGKSQPHDVKYCSTITYKPFEKKITIITPV